MRPRLSLAHAGYHRAQGAKRAEEVGVELRLGVLEPKFLDAAIHPVARIANHRVELLHPARNLGETGDHGLLAADIHRDPMNRWGARTQRAGISAGSKDLEASREQTLGGRGADAG